MAEHTEDRNGRPDKPDDDNLDQRIRGDLRQAPHDDDPMGQGRQPASFVAKERTVHVIVRAGVPVIGESTALSALPDLFAQSRSPAAVLVDTDRKPMGAVTPVDLFGAVTKHGPASLADIGMRDAAKARVLYLRGDTRLSSALRLFAEERPEFILVVSETGRLIGLVSAAELLGYLTQ
jgi:CBS-domain-containing membrane protein